MRSNICKIEKGTRDLEAILKESERVAEQMGLAHKQALQLRLLCEELDGMLPYVIDQFEGEFWIDFEDGLCKIQVSIQIPELNTDKKAELISIAKSKKNAAAVGIVGKIRNAIENLLLDDKLIDSLASSAEAYGLSTSYGEDADSAYLWRLEDYRSEAKQQKDAWDELEKSVIASVADDVTVGVRGRRAEVVIVKTFA
jgi:hypothetical protein